MHNSSISALCVYLAFSPILPPLSLYTTTTDSHHPNREASPWWDCIYRLAQRTHLRIWPPVHPWPWSGVRRIPRMDIVRITQTTYIPWVRLLWWRVLFRTILTSPIGRGWWRERRHRGRCWRLWRNQNNHFALWRHCVDDLNNLRQCVFCSLSVPWFKW
jgi:hypothetical protein